MLGPVIDDSAQLTVMADSGPGIAILLPRSTPMYPAKAAGIARPLPRRRSASTWIRRHQPAGLQQQSAASVRFLSTGIVSSWLVRRRTLPLSDTMNIGAPRYVRTEVSATP